MSTVQALRHCRVRTANMGVDDELYYTSTEVL